MTPLAQLFCVLALIVAFASVPIGVALWIFAVVVQLLAQAGVGIGITQPPPGPPVEPFGPDDD